MNQQKNVSDHIGRSIFSLGAVLFPLLVLTGGMLFASHTYFHAMLPPEMESWQRIAAAWLMAIAWECTVLVTTANENHVPRWIPRTMAFFTGVIFLFFIGAFDSEITGFVRLQKLMLGTLVSFVSWVFVELFARKWKERTAGFSLPELLTKAQAALSDLQARFDQLTQSFNENQRTVSELRSELDEKTLKLVELEGYRLSIVAQLTCEHCDTVFDKFDSLRSHKGRCEHNPNGLQKQGRAIALNGHKHD